MPPKSDLITELPPFFDLITRVPLLHTNNYCRAPLYMKYRKRRGYTDSMITILMSMIFQFFSNHSIIEI